MSKYRTCHNCRFADGNCARRSQMRESIAGLGITSLKFCCPDRQATYLPGDRVSVTWLVPLCDEPSYQDWQKEMWPATVIREIGSKFLICVDDVDSDEGTPAKEYVKNETLYCKVAPTKLNRRQEPSRTICGTCGQVAGGGSSSCWYSDPEAIGDRSNCFLTKDAA